MNKALAVMLELFLKFFPMFVKLERVEMLKRRYYLVE